MVAADADMPWLGARGISQPMLLKSFVGGKCCGLAPTRVMGGSPCPEQFTLSVGELEMMVSVRPEQQEAVLGSVVGVLIPSSNVATQVFPEPFPAPVCQTPFHRGCWSCFPINAALVRAPLAAAQEIKVIEEQ